RFKRLRIERDLPPGLPNALANDEQMIQVLMALMLNGVDAMDETGTLTVRTRQNPARRDELFIEVADTGHGIAEEDLPKIFEPFRIISGGLHDLAILDLRLPGMTGLQVLRTIRDRGITTPILVLTAQDAVGHKVEALRAGADDYVTKPFAFEEVLARVEALS